MQLGLGVAGASLTMKPPQRADERQKRKEMVLTRLTEAQDPALLLATPWTSHYVSQYLFIL